MSDENTNPVTLPATPARSKFAVFVPTDESLTGIYNSKTEAFSVIQAHKGARFVLVSDEAGAQDFFCSEKQIASTPRPSTAVAEDYCPFSTPSLYSEVFSAVNRGDIGALRSLIEINPLFLITKVDAPTILHQGARYNALHLCANKNLVDVAKWIIDLIKSGDLFSRLYPNDSRESRQSRIRRVLDMYINSPDKYQSETPLHFASKMGNADMVWLLASQPECILDAKNKNKQTAADIICDRVPNASQEQHQRIKRALTGQYYVTILRSLSSPLEPLVRPPIRATSDHFVVSNLLNKEDSILYRLSGYIGPLTQERAKDVFETLTKPHRRRRQLNDSFRMNESALLTPNRSTFNETLSLSPRTASRGLDPVVMDPRYGLENFARKISSADTPFYECFEFLQGEGLDLPEPSALNRLEETLKAKHLSACRCCEICNPHSLSIILNGTDNKVRPEEDSLKQELTSETADKYSSDEIEKSLNSSWRLIKEPVWWFGRMISGVTGYFFRRNPAPSPSRTELKNTDKAHAVTPTPRSSLSRLNKQNATLSESFIEQFAAMTLTSNDTPRQSKVQSPVADDSNASQYTSSPKTVTGEKSTLFFGTDSSKPSDEDIRIFKIISSAETSGNSFLNSIDFPFLTQWFEHVRFVKEHTLIDMFLMHLEEDSTSAKKQKSLLVLSDRTVSLSDAHPVLLLKELIAVTEKENLAVSDALYWSTILADKISVPPAVEDNFFWKCVLAGLKLCDALISLDGFSPEFQCLCSKLDKVLGEAVFSCPEDIIMKRCVDEIGSTVAALCESRQFCTELLAKMFGAVGVIARFERKSSKDLFSKSGLSLMKSLLRLNFPAPVHKSLGNVLSIVLSHGSSDNSGLLPTLLLKAVSTNGNEHLHVVLAVFLPVIKFSSNNSLALDKRDILDDLCWKTLSETIITSGDSLMCNDDDLALLFLKGLAEFLSNQRASSAEGHLKVLLQFAVRYHCEPVITALSQVFLNAGKLELFLTIVLDSHLAVENDWLVPLVGEWLKNNFSLTTPSFASVWKFLLTKTYKADSSAINIAVVEWLHGYLTGLQAFGHQENVVPSVRSDFMAMCLETESVLTSAELLQHSDDEKYKLPVINCMSSLISLISLTATESADQTIEKDLQKKSKKLQKLLKSRLEKILTDASNNEEAVLNCLVSQLHSNSSSSQLLDCFLSDHLLEKNFDIMPAVRYYVQSAGNSTTELSKETAVSMLNCLISHSTPSECAGLHFISFLRLLDERHCLANCLESIDDSSSKQSKLINILASPKCLQHLSSLPFAFRNRVLEFALQQLLNNSNAKRHSKNCSLKFVAQLLKRDSDIIAFDLFKKCDVAKMMDLLERHSDCHQDAALKLSTSVCHVALSNDDAFSQWIDFVVGRLAGSKASHIICQCLALLCRKLRVKKGHENFRRFMSLLANIEEKFEFSVEQCRAMLSKNTNDFSDRWFLLAVCFISLLDWPRFGQKLLTFNHVFAIYQAASSLEDEFERNLWAHPLTELLSNCLKAQSLDENLLRKTSEMLVSETSEKFDSNLPAFVTIWQTIFKSAGGGAAQLLRHITFVNSELLAEENNKRVARKFGPLCCGYLKALLSACDNEEHCSDDHENAFWNEGEGSTQCNAVKMALALYEDILAYPCLGILCLPSTAQFGFFDAGSKGLLSFDFLLGIVSAAARSPAMLSSSSLFFNSYCCLLRSLLRLRSAQQENELLPIRLTNVLHIILFCLSAAFSCVLEFPLSEELTASHLLELGKLVAMAGHRRRMLADVVVHVIASALVSGVRAPAPAGYAGLAPIYRKQFISIIVQLFLMCSERVLKSMALFLPQECLPLLKSIRSEAFVQSKTRRKA